MTSKGTYELVAKNNFVVAKVLGTIVALTTMYDVPKELVLGVLVVLAAGFSTVSTYAWMSR